MGFLGLSVLDHQIFVQIAFQLHFIDVGPFPFFKSYEHVGYIDLKNINTFKWLIV